MKQAARIDARMRQAAGAALAALVLWAIGATQPLDQLIWVVQARLASFQTSGDIVFAGAGTELEDPAFPGRRHELARALRKLSETDVERVYVDVVFNRKSTSAADEDLRAAMEGLGDRLYLVQRYKTAADGNDQLQRSIPEIGEGIQQVGKSNFIYFSGFIWNAPYSLAQHGNPLPSLPVSLADSNSTSDRDFPIQYGFELSSIPMLDVADVAEGRGASPLDRAVDGRTVLIGNADELARNSVNIPGHTQVPSSLVQIYAAETLKAGLTDQIRGWAVLLLCALVLGLSLTAWFRSWSGRAFGLLLAAQPAIIVAASVMGVRVDMAASLVFLALYSALGAKAHWRNRLKLVDPMTELPTFAALEANKAVALAQPTIVVGKIHRFEDVKRTLPENLHGEYVANILERLRLNSDDTTFYIGHGHYLAWCVPERNHDAIKDHLEGLRALLAAPLSVGTELVDASMTFSVDTSASANIAKRLAAAVAAVDRTTEADNPIAATEIKTDEDLLWNISLQSRIDAALANKEIYVVFQPKVLLSTGDVIGLEALVRWNDPGRGLIPPDLFIRQCESAGRMLHLTRHVLHEACRAGKSFEACGQVLPIAVNISATQLHDWELVTVLQQVLDETGFEPGRLSLEITETYRISSLETAHQILAEIAALGIKLSMDDFGVGAASFEALLRLPFSELKIDRVFVSRITENPKARGIVKHLLQLGKELRIIVVAEGVEDDATLSLLKDLGCLIAQGYALAPPLTFQEVLDSQNVTGKGAAAS